MVLTQHAPGFGAGYRWTGRVDAAQRGREGLTLERVRETDSG